MRFPQHRSNSFLCLLSPNTYTIWKSGELLNEFRSPPPILFPPPFPSLLSFSPVSPAFPPRKALAYSFNSFSQLFFLHYVFTQPSPPLKNIVLFLRDWLSFHLLPFCALPPFQPKLYRPAQHAKPQESPLAVPPSVHSHLVLDVYQCPLNERPRDCFPGPPPLGRLSSLVKVSLPPGFLCLPPAPPHS